MDRYALANQLLERFARRRNAFMLSAHLDRYAIGATLQASSPAWDEQKHPRDTDGRFAETEGGRAKKQKPSGRLVLPKANSHGPTEAGQDGRVAVYRQFLTDEEKNLGRTVQNIPLERRRDAKAKVVDQLTSALADDPDFKQSLDELAEAQGLHGSKRTSEQVVNRLVQEWANTSGNSPLAIAVQLAAQQEFGLPPYPGWDIDAAQGEGDPPDIPDGAVWTVDVGYDDEEPVTFDNQHDAEAFSNVNGGIVIPNLVASQWQAAVNAWLANKVSAWKVKRAHALMQDAGPGLRAYVRAQYDATQDWLQKHLPDGVDHVTLYRGMHFQDQEEAALAVGGGDNDEFGLDLSGLFSDVRSPEKRHWADAEITHRPLSSYTIDPGTATSFSSGGGDVQLLAAVDVPIKRILSTPFTGSGCLSEGEIVCMPGTTRGRVTWSQPGQAGQWLAADRLHWDQVGQKALYSRKAQLIRLDADALEHNADWPKRTNDVLDVDRYALARAELYALQKTFEWDEDKHPRDADGQFAEKDDSHKGRGNATNAVAETEEPAKSDGLPTIFGSDDLPILNQMPGGGDPNGDTELSETKKKTELLPLEDYDKILVQFSGGKDSLATVLHLLDQGVPKDKIELWHQLIDGDGERFMDWASTPDYVRKVAEHLGLKLRLQWKDGGFKGELERKDQPSGGVWYEDEDGERHYLEPQGKPGERGMPCPGPIEKGRWCSALLKIDVLAKTIRNDPRFSKQGKEGENPKLLVVTGERREEGGRRANYYNTEKHRTDAETRRHVDHWRPILEWPEQKVWDKIKEAGINPHPAYHLGYNRLSCQHCIFADPDQVASNLELDPANVKKLGEFEDLKGQTIKTDKVPKSEGGGIKKVGIVEFGERGTSFVSDKPQEIKDLAMSREYTAPVTVEDWTMPAGAFQRGQGAPYARALHLMDIQIDRYFRSIVAVERYKQLQRTLWDEQKHPRDADGKFAETGSHTSLSTPRRTLAELRKELESATSDKVRDQLRKGIEKHRVRAKEEYKARGYRSRYFKDWFGDWEKDPEGASKVVTEDGEPAETHSIPGDASQVTDGNGNPVVVYHGSQAKFEAFDPEHDHGRNLYGKGFYFTEARDVAEGVWERSTAADLYPTKGEADQAAELAEGDADVREIMNPTTGKTEWAVFHETKKLEAPGYAQKGITLDPDQMADLADILEKRADTLVSVGRMSKADALDLHTFLHTVRRQADPSSMIVPQLLQRQHSEDLDIWGSLMQIGAPVAGHVYPTYLNIRKPFDASQNRMSKDDVQALVGAVVNRQADLPDSRHLQWLARELPEMDDGVQVWRRVGELLGVDGANELIREAGFDGITHTGGGNGWNPQSRHRVWIAFEPNQVKAVENQGTFDPSDDRMHYSRMFNAAFRQRYRRIGSCRT